MKPKKKRFRPADGIRKKILYGFIILGSLLLFSGMVSYFELSRLSRTTRQLVDNSVHDLELSKEMLNAVNQQNAALFIQIHTPQSDSLYADSLFRAGRLNFDTSFQEAEVLKRHTEKLKNIQSAKATYDTVLSDPIADSLLWYDHLYKIAYYDLALAVKDLMIDSQKKIDENAETIQDNAYRAIMPGVITLAIAVLILFIFFILIDLYYIRPVLKIKHGLENYLNMKVPYTVQVEGKDEVKELSDQIMTLVAMSKKKEPNA